MLGAGVGAVGRGGASGCCCWCRVNDKGCSQDEEVTWVHSQGLDVEGYSLLVLLPELPLEEVPEVVVSLVLRLLQEELLAEERLVEELLVEEPLTDARLEALWALGAGL